MSLDLNRQLILLHRPTDNVGDECFELVRSAVPPIADGEALVRVRWLGIDPTQRTWLNSEHTYTSPAKIGAVMPGSGVGQVMESRRPDLAEGDWVLGPTGWQDYAVAGPSGLMGLNRIPDGVRPLDMLSVLGVNGLTAYFGMLDIGRPKKGETIFVSGAAGSVGSIAAQIAKRQGCIVIGTAGGPQKCAWTTEVAGVDHCIDYKNADLEQELSKYDGKLDLVFDNVGGAVLEGVLDRLALGARIILCGSISSGYRSRSYGHGPRNYMQLAFRRARMEGFIFLDYASRFPEAFHALRAWQTEGALRTAETIMDGLASAPRALASLFEGANLGKMIVKVS